MRSSSPPASASSYPHQQHASSIPTYTQLHQSLHHAHDDASSDDDELDPRWLNNRITQARAKSRSSSSAAGGSSSSASSAAPSRASNPAAASGNDSQSPLRRSNIARTSRHEASGGSSSGPGHATSSSSDIDQPWRTAHANPATASVSASHQAAASSSSSPLTTVQMHEVDLSGMTSEQRDLLDYYKARIDAFDRERVDFLRRLDEMSGNSREKHTLKWEMHKKDEQMMDMQKALSDAHVYLYEERAQVLKLTAENDRLKIEAMEDRQRLEHLLALTQPINQEVTYFRECRPEKLTKNYPGQRDDIYSAQRDMRELENAPQESPKRQVLHTSRGAAAVDPNSSSSSSVLSRSHSSSSLSQSRRSTTTGTGVSTKKRSSARPVVRTIYLPNENIDILKQIISSLRAQLSEQQALFDQRIQALQEDRAIREQETAEVQRKANAHMEELAKELKATHDMNKTTTRDYLELRHAAQAAERKLKERASSLSQQQLELQKHLKDVQQKAHSSETALQSENASYVSLFRQQTAATEEDLAIMKSQYLATQDLYEKRIRYLENRIVTVKGKLATVSERRALELEGYQTDVTQMREKLRKIEYALLSVKTQAQAVAQEAADQQQSSSQSERQSKRRNERMMEEKQQSQYASELPPRLSATFELLGEDIRKLQGELTGIARRIKNT